MTSTPAYSGYARFEGDSLGDDLEIVSTKGTHNVFTGCSESNLEPEFPYKITISNFISICISSYILYTNN